MTLAPSSSLLADAVASGDIMKAAVRFNHVRRVIGSVVGIFCNVLEDRLSAALAGTHEVNGDNTVKSEPCSLQSIYRYTTPD